jgi:hypothetical protein
MPAVCRRTDSFQSCEKEAQREMFLLAKWEQMAAAIFIRTHENTHSFWSFRLNIEVTVAEVLLIACRCP